MTEKVSDTAIWSGGPSPIDGFEVSVVPLFGGRARIVNHLGLGEDDTGVHYFCPDGEEFE